LFAAKPEPRFVFFSEATSSSAKVMLNGKLENLVRTNSRGDVLDLHYTEQTYDFVAKDMTLTVTINAASRTDGGHQIDKAALRMNAPGGWKMVIPVGGATSCQ
jgi:hypothetical protein